MKEMASVLVLFHSFEQTSTFLKNFEFKRVDVILLMNLTIKGTSVFLYPTSMYLVSSLTIDEGSVRFVNTSNIK